MWSEADRETYKDDGRRYPSDLTDEAWALIAPLLSGYDPLTADLREMVNACLYLECGYLSPMPPHCIAFCKAHSYAGPMTASGVPH